MSQRDTGFIVELKNGVDFIYRAWPRADRKAAVPSPRLSTFTAAIASVI